MPNARPAEVEPFRRGCVWPAGELAAYPRCDPGPLGLRLPADTRASASHSVGVRLEFTGACREVEISYRTQTREIGYCGAGASAERLPDGIHPDDAGHVLLARSLGPALRAAFEGASHA